MRLERMRPISLEPIAAVDAVSPVSPAAAPRPVPEIDWSKDVPEVWRPCVEPIAEAVRAVSTEWHQLFLALAGALLSRRVPQEHVPAICRAISAATKADTRTEDREASARTTVQRHLAGLPTTGYGTLAATWPAVANALDKALARGTEAHLRALATADAAVKPRTLAETTAVALGDLNLALRRLTAHLDYFALYPSKLVSQNSDGTLELKPDDSRLPGLSKVPIRYGIPGVTVSLLNQQLVAWTLLKQKAGEALRTLADELGAMWRVLPDGTVWLGQESWPAVHMPDVDLLSEDPRAHTAVIGTDSPTLLPGTLFLGRRVSMVEHQIQPESVRTMVWFEGESGSGEGDRLTRAVGAIVRHLPDFGFLYKGETFRSLSAAAMAAAKDLGLAGAQNGFVFWSLVKPAPRVTDPVEALQAAWNRYHERVKAIAAGELEAPVKVKISNALDRQGREIIELGSTL